MGDLNRGLPRGYSNKTIDGPNLLSYRYYIAGNLGHPEVNGWKFDKNF